MWFVPVGLLVLFLIIIGLWCISTSNRFNRLGVKIAESESGIDVALTMRHDTLTKTLAVCKGYAQHESDLFSHVVQLRKGMSMEQKIEANRQMDQIAEHISILAENYPELRASENFLQLQETISEVEDTLSAARRLYNMNVSTYNQLLCSFPSSIIGNAKHLQPKPFFVAEETKRKDVNMEF